MTNPEAIDPSPKPNSLPWLILALALLLGAFVRLGPTLVVDFPLNDGGLFYAMAQDIRTAGYRLPVYTSYNNAEIPFAYQPLAFYLVSGIADLTGWKLLDLFRILPAVVSVLTIPAFYGLARRVLHSRLQAVLSTLVFALLPWSFLQLIKGGGLTRSVGFLLALLTLPQIYLLYQDGRNRFVLTTVLFSSLTVYSHPDMTLLIVYSAVLFFLFYGRSRQALARSLVVAAGVALLTAPWWLTVVLRHGPSPLFSAVVAGSQGWGERLLSLIAFNFSGEVFSSLLGILGLLGMVWAVAKKRYLLPIWQIILFFPRGESTHVIVPLALLVGLALDQMVLPAVGPPTMPGQPGAVPNRALGPLAGVGPKFVLFLLLLHGLLSSWGVTRPGLAFVHVLSPETRAAMAWATENTSPDSAFLLVTDESWWKDPASEWFPALTQRASLATPQGYEWLPQGQFQQRVELYDSLQLCAEQESTCLQDWATTAQTPFAYVYVSKSCCSSLRHSLQLDADYELIYNEPGVVIFARRSP